MIFIKWQQKCQKNTSKPGKQSKVSVPLRASENICVTWVNCPFKPVLRWIVSLILRILFKKRHEHQWGRINHFCLLPVELGKIQQVLCCYDIWAVIVSFSFLRSSLSSGLLIAPGDTCSASALKSTRVSLFDNACDPRGVSSELNSTEVLKTTRCLVDSSSRLPHDGELCFFTSSVRPTLRSELQASGGSPLPSHEFSLFQRDTHSSRGKSIRLPASRPPVNGLLRDWSQTCRYISVFSAAKSTNGYKI